MSDLVPAESLSYWVAAAALVARPLHTCSWCHSTAGCLQAPAATNPISQNSSENTLQWRTRAVEPSPGRQGALQGLIIISRQISALAVVSLTAPDFQQTLGFLPPWVFPQQEA